MAYGFSRGGGNRGGFNRRPFGGPREMHKIKCSECGKDAEVPFKPRGDLPVYCRECFFKKKGITPRAPMGEEKAEKAEKTEKKDEFEEEAESEEVEEEA